MLGYLPRLEPDRAHGVAPQDAAVKDEPQAARPAHVLGEVHAHQAPSPDLDPALLARLTPGRLPGRLIVRLQLSAGIVQRRL